MASPLLGEPLMVFLHPAPDPDPTERLRRGPCPLNIQPPTAHCARWARQWHGGKTKQNKKKPTKTHKPWTKSHATANSHFNTGSCHLTLPVQHVNYAARIIYIYPGAKLERQGMPRPWHTLTRRWKRVPPRDCSPIPIKKTQNTKPHKTAQNRI